MITKAEKEILGFWLRVDKSGKCWTWTGYIANSGYGVYRKQLAHRYAYRQKKGPVDGLIIRHKCDNPLCVRPSHLVAGTYTENMNDMMSRGRARGGSRKGSVGELNNRTLLTTSEAQKVVNLRAMGLPIGEISRRVGLPHWQVSKIARGQSWGHLRPTIYNSDGS